MHFVLAFLVIIVYVQGYKVARVTFPLDSDIRILRRSEITSKVSQPQDPNCGRRMTDAAVPKPNPFKHKKVMISWNTHNGSNKGHILFPLEFPNTAVIKTINNIAAFPVLSIDYGSKFVGLSMHHMGKTEILRGILNSGNVEQTCESIYSVVKQEIRPPTRFILLVGLPFSRDQLTEGKCLFQTLYCLDFATRLSRYIYRQHLEVYGNWEHVLKDKLPETTCSEIESCCFACKLDLGWCLYNRECSESFVLEPSDYSSAAVIGISEEFSSYQTEIFRGSDNVRRDSLSSDLIFRNLIEALDTRQMHRMPFLVLPSNNSIFRNHAKGDCMLFYKDLCRRISTCVK